MEILLLKTTCGAVRDKPVEALDSQPKRWCAFPREAQCTGSILKGNSGTSPQHLTAATPNPETRICVSAPHSQGLQ